MLSLFKKPRRAGSPSDLSAAQAAAAEAGLEFRGLNDTKSAEKILRKHGLSLEIAEAYVASQSPATEEAAPVDAAPAEDMNRMNVGVPAGYSDTIEQRGKLTGLLWGQFGEGWQVETFDARTRKATAVRGTPDHRPHLEKMDLDDEFKASDAAILARKLADDEGESASLIDCDHLSARALTAEIPPATLTLRNRLAQALKVQPWAGPDGLEIGLEFGPLGSVFGITKLTVFRFPLGSTAEKRKEIWLELARSFVAYVPKTEWHYEDQLATSGQLVISRVLDPLLGVLPYPVDAEPSYTAIPFGVDENHQPLSLGLLAMNQLLGGIPGGGKSGGLTTLITGISKLPNVALIGLDPKLVELQLWEDRFSRIEITAEGASEVLALLLEEMDRRYRWLRGKKLKKFTPQEFSTEFPLIVMVIDELAELVAAGGSPDEKKADVDRSLAIRRLIAKGRAAGIVVITATQKPSSDVIPTGLRDLIQLRVAYATTNGDMTDTILGKGMGQMGGLAHVIPADMQGTCYVIAETSRTPIRARTYWVPDDDVEGLAASTAHLRVHLPWLGGAPVQELAEMTLDLEDLEMEMEDLELGHQDGFDSEPETESAAFSSSSADDEEDPFITQQPRVNVAGPVELEDDDPFADSTPKKKFAIDKADGFNWDSPA